MRRGQGVEKGGKGGKDPLLSEDGKKATECGRHKEGEEEGKNE